MKVAGDFVDDPMCVTIYVRSVKWLVCCYGGNSCTIFMLLNFIICWLIYW